MPYFQTRESELFYRSSGKGKTALVFIHGWYQNGAQAWDSLSSRFGAGYRVIVPDLPGHGLSPKMPVDFSIESNERLLLEFLIDIRRTYRLQKIVLLGHSYGAFATLHLTANHPKAVDALVAMAAVDDYAPYKRRLRAVLSVPVFLESLYFKLQALLELFPYGDRRMLYSKVFPELAPGRLEYALIKNRTLPLRASRQYMRAFLPARVDWPEEKLKNPLLLLYGERDGLTPASWAGGIRAHFQQSSVHIIPKAGHNVQIAGAETIAPIITRFVEKSFRHRDKK
jgi:pimeloyl-ACP methyl ester carboxylesterase